MLQSFYKYLSALLIEFFRTNAIEPGNKYHLIIEDKAKRQSLLNSLKQQSCAEELSISNIYQYNSLLGNIEEPYDTFYLAVGSHNPKLLIGDSDSANDDYLATLRNAVGVHGRPLENYAILFILSSNRIESLTTASVNLLKKGMPLYFDNIQRSIRTQIDANIINECEREYLYQYLDQLSSSVGDGRSSLFDLEDILAIVQDKSLKKSFSRIGYIEDDQIYGITFDKRGRALTDYIHDNADYFRQIQEIMSSNTLEEERPEKLSKFLDDKLVDDIIKWGTEKWKDELTYSMLLKSVFRKQSQEVLTYEGAEFKGHCLSNLYLISRGSSSSNKKGTFSIIVCDPRETETTEIQLAFNKGIRELVKGEGFQTNGRFLNLSLTDAVTRISVGEDNNIFKFVITRIKTKPETFRDIANCFTIKASGDIVVNIPEDYSTIRFGYGTTQIDLGVSTIEWLEDYSLLIPIEDEITNASIKFGNKTVKFILKMDSKKIVPISPEKIFEKIWMEKATFKNSNKSDFESQPYYKICWGEEEFSTYEKHRYYLLLEKQMIDNDIYYLKKQVTAFGTQFVQDDDFCIPDAITETLKPLFKYFRDNNCLPSLTYLDPTLSSLYEQYLQSVLTVISCIPTNRSLTREEYYLTRLGVVEQEDIIALSPLHPLMVAYQLELKKRFDPDNVQEKIFKLLSPFYLIPYLYYNSQVKRPYCDDEIDGIRSWLFYEDVNQSQQVRTYNITTDMVREKMREYIKNFPYLFQDSECPIIISTIGITDDANVVKGVIQFIVNEYETHDIVQRIEIHEYVDNILHETFFELINRINSEERIISELRKHNIDLDGYKISSQEIIRQLFSRVSFYKHEVKDDTKIGYSHIAFYQMDSGEAFCTPNTNELRVELSLGGLISIPSTKNKNGVYTIGLGTNGLNTNGLLYEAVVALNNLYANEKEEGASQFHTQTCVAKRFSFKSAQLLNSIYDNSNWVTFLNPEVDIDFFYKQEVYIVHYTDQYTINAKYDSITVTRHIDQYKNMLTNAFGRYTTVDTNIPEFNERIMNYFNCLNGSWLLSIINKTDEQVREKLSIVSASIATERLLRRCNEIIWLPISLEEILRVTGSIKLPMDFFFTKKDLQLSGSMSDDLLMIGLDYSNPDAISLVLYPVEVKASPTSTFTQYGANQAIKTYEAFRKNLFGEISFSKMVYRTFFASQFLSAADKFRANDLMSESDFEIINNHRCDLLNLNFTIREEALGSLGSAGLVSFHAGDQHSLTNRTIDGVQLCHLNMAFDECVECIKGGTNALSTFLDSGLIHVVQPEVVVQPNASESPTQVIETSEEPTSSTDQPSVPEEEQPNPSDSITESTEPEVIMHAPLPKKKGIKILVGHPKSRPSESVFFEPNNTKKVSHPNLGIIGTMGTGKTQFARSIIAQLSKEGGNNVGGNPVGVLVFDYKGDYKDSEFLSAVDGHSYKFNYPFNPLKLVLTEDLEGMNLPAITADRISDSFAKAYGLGLKQQSNIKQIIVDTYADFGITRDPSTWTNTPPTMDNVVQKYFDNYDANDKAYALFSKLQDYTIFTTNNQDCVSLFEWLDGVKVIDLTMYPDDTKKVIVSLILDLFYNEMRQLGSSRQEEGFRELRTMIMVDEAHQFLKKDFNSFRSIISEGRMFGVGMILSTQNISDFKSSQEDYSSFILSWVIHHVNTLSKAELASIFGPNDPHTNDYMSFINNAKLFESICKLGSRIEGIRDLPFFELVQQDDRFHIDN